MRVRQLRSQFALVLGERSRIARELHDTLIQGFSGITMQLQALTARLSSDEQRATLQEIIHEAGTCLQETRRSVAGLRAGAGASSGLSEAIETAAHTITDHQDVRLRLDLDDAHCELPAEVKYNLVCIAQEAVTNSLKHAAARTISVGLELVNKELVLSISDDGRGMSLQPRAEGHYGMVGMRERVYP
jgi:signal transduction histidine kinase